MLCCVKASVEEMKIKIKIKMKMERIDIPHRTASCGERGMKIKIRGDNDFLQKGEIEILSFLSVIEAYHIDSVRPIAMQWSGLFTNNGRKIDAVRTQSCYSGVIGTLF